jgi:hypothetical protein
MKKLTIIFACTLLLLLVYVASYSLDVSRFREWVLVHTLNAYKEGQTLPVSAAYRYGGRWAETIYFPLQSLDRHIRPEYWNYTFHY